METVHKIFKRMGKTTKSFRLSRILWQSVHGPIQDGLLVCHKCDNRACINVNHLFLGTYQDNYRDCQNKGRNAQPRGEQSGRHKLKITDVLAIKFLIELGTPDTQIAPKYGVTVACIRSIRIGRTWSHLGHS